jgi:hypothetical protein
LETEIADNPVSAFEEEDTESVEWSFIPEADPPPEQIQKPGLVARTLASLQAMARRIKAIVSGRR